MDATECKRQVARDKIDQADGSVKLAIVMILLQTDVDGARQKLKEASGHIRCTLDSK